MAGNDPKVTFKVFNEDFNKGIREMNDEGKKLRQELKLEQEQLKLTGSESQKLASRLGSLQKQYDTARQKTAATAAQLEKVKGYFGENSVEAARMETALRRAQIAEQQLANKIDQTSTALAKAKDAESGATAESDRRRQSLSQLKQEEQSLQSASKRLTSEYNLQKAELGDNASEADKLAAAQNHIQQQMANSRLVVANLTEQLQLTEKEYGQNSAEANQMATRLNNAKASVQKFENELRDLQTGAENAGESLDDIGKKVSAGNFLQASEQISNIGEKMMELGGSAIGVASEFDQSQNDIRASLGLTAGQAEKVNGVVSQVWKDGFGDAVGDAEEAVSHLYNVVGDIPAGEMTALTEKVMAFSRVFGLDATESVTGLNTTMRNFGLNASDALDYITMAAQNTTGQFRQDLPDALTELAPTFHGMGANAQQAFEMMIAAQKSGMENFDALSSLTQGFTDNMSSGSEDVSAAFKSLGGNAAATFKSFQDGGASAYDVFVATAKQLGDMDDKTKVNQIGAQLFGDTWTEAGADAVTSLGNVDGKLKGVKGSSDSLTDPTPMQEWQSAIRSLQTALAPIGEDFARIMTPLADTVSKMAQGFQKLPTPVRMAIEVIGGLAAAFTILTPVMAALIIVFGAFSVQAGVLTVTIGGLSFALWPVLAVIAAVIAAIAGVILVIKNWGAITEWLKGIWSAFTAWLGTLWQGISALAQTIWGGMSSFFVGLWTGIVNVGKAIWGGLSIFFGFLWELVKSIFISAWTVISSLLIAAWNVLVALTKPIWQPVANFFKAMWNGIKNVTSTVWNAIKGFLTTVWNAIKSFVSPIFNAIGSTISNIWNKIKSVTSTVWNAIKGFLMSIWNGIKGTTSSVWNGIKGVINSVWNGIKSGVSSAVNKVKSTVTNVWNGIKSVTSRVWNAVKSAITGPINSARDAVGRAIDRIKGFFSGLKLKFPKINMPPLPHFSLEGKFSLVPPRVPRIGVKWYAQGGFFDQPNVIGIGEAGPEAALPLSGSRMDPFADAVANRLLSRLPETAVERAAQTVNNRNTVIINATIRNDQDIDKLAEKLDERFGTMGQRESAAWGGTS